MHEARTEEMRTVHKICLQKSQVKALGRLGICGMVLKILYHEVSYTYSYKTECGSPLLQTEDR